VVLPVYVRAESELRFNDLAGFDAAGADANPFVSAIHLSLDRPKIHIPAALGYIVRVRNLVSELWTFTADLANLSHHKLQYSELFAQTCGGLTLFTNHSNRCNGG
jgi:hypothetical protein